MELLIGLLQFIGFIIFFLLLLLAITFIKHFIRHVREIEQRKQLEEVKQEINEQLAESMLVYVEKVGDMIHMYDKISGYFVAQGKDLEELWEKAELRCPNMNLVLSDPQEEK